MSASRRQRTGPLDYLEEKQIKEGPEAGSWNTNQAFNALAMLAFMSKGHVPGRGRYGDLIEGGAVKPGVLTRAKKYMLSKAQPTGYISSSSMYEHGLSTLALAEMYGMDPDPDLEVKLRKAVDLIIKTQSPAGGWRYTPAPVDQDMSVTVMQIVALRGQQRRGAGAATDVRESDQVCAFLRRRNRRLRLRRGGFGTADQCGRRPVAATARQTRRCEHSENDPLPDDDPGAVGRRNPNYFYYFHYYAIQAFYQAGGKEWNDWHPRVREMLLEKQNKDGSWDVPPGSAEAGLVTPTSKIYSTAMATLVLNIYMHYLPAYQR